MPHTEKKLILTYVIFVLVIKEKILFILDFKVTFVLFLFKLKKMNLSIDFDDLVIKM